MVKVHDLSAALVFQLERDFTNYYQLARRAILKAGAQLPRTRYGWLRLHFESRMKKRGNAIMAAVKEFNRDRNVPLNTKVFKDSRQYAGCLTPIEITEDGNVAYRSASDPVWNSTLNTKFVINMKQNNNICKHLTLA